MMLSEIATMRIEERLREGAEARRAGQVPRRRKQSRVRRFVGLSLVRAGNADIVAIDATVHATDG